MAETKTNKERLKEITDGIEQGIKELFQSEKYRTYLSVMSRFHRYSVNNTMLIFAAIISEAEKYLGYPYVWGGSSPSTSFDCSGFVSWVINQSGWDVGRLGVDALYSLCSPVSASEAKPGDLVFFQGTYDTSSSFTGA